MTTENNNANNNQENTDNTNNQDITQKPAPQVPGEAQTPAPPITQQPPTADTAPIGEPQPVPGVNRENTDNKATTNTEHSVSVSGVFSSDKKFAAGTKMSDVLAGFSSKSGSYDFVDASTGKPVSANSTLNSDMKLTVTEKAKRG